MFACPSCTHTALTRVQTEGGILWRCPKCDGRVLNLSMLRRRVPHQYVTQLWQTILAKEESGGDPSPKRCPSCQAPMWQILAPQDDRQLELDACRPCHFIWFDQDELGQTPPKSPGDTDQLVKPFEPTFHIRQEGVLADISTERGPRSLAENAPEEWWQVVCTFLGMPIEENAPERTSLPMATWILTALMVFVYLAGLIAGDTHDLHWELGFIPSDPFRYFGLTVVSSFLLHAGWVHLLGNLYFFLVFGDNTENHLGAFNYLLLLFLATAAGDFCHALADPRSDIPLVGASGGISGILMFYALQFRQVRIVFMVRWWIAFRFFRLSIKWALLLWVLFQFYGAYQQIAGFSNVSALAHLGGAAAGVIAYFANQWWTEQGATIARIKDKKIITKRRRSLHKHPEKKKRRPRGRRKDDRPDLWGGRRRH